MDQIITTDQTLKDATALAWAAGFLDGEGCISLSRTVQPGRKNPTYRPRVDVCQNDREVLVYLRDVLAEDAGLYVNRWQPGHNRQVYTLVYDGIHALQALAKLLPHLRRKDIEAEVLLSYPERGWMGVHPGPHGYPQEVWAERERIYRKLRKLK